MVVKAVIWGFARSWTARPPPAFVQMTISAACSAVARRVTAFAAIFPVVTPRLASLAVTTDPSRSFAALMFAPVATWTFVMKAVRSSFDLIPLYGGRYDASLLNHLVGLFSHVFVIGLKVSSPVIITIFLTNISLGLLARVMPQMNIFMVGLTLQIVIGFTVLFLSVPMLGVSYAQAMTRMGILLSNFVRAF